MKIHQFLLCLLSLITVLPVSGKNPIHYPTTIRIDSIDGGHVQGIAVDEQHQYVYLSFTTKLIKTDFNGHVLGSVTGLYGHLGCIDYNEQDGKVYGSLEYKNDAIGQGILAREGKKGKNATAFYVAIFDVGRITRKEMNAGDNGVMQAVYLPTVVADYEADVTTHGHRQPHRFACSGIDGLCFGPRFGHRDGKLYLTVAYGIYGDTARTDNDYQVLLQYDVSKTSQWKRFVHSISQNRPLRVGPKQPYSRCFLFTGNTNWGVQNLEYDESRGQWYAAVYSGRKQQYPNYSLFNFAASQQPRKASLRGVDYLPTSQPTLHYNRGWHYPYGSTGMCALSDGHFYVAQPLSKGKLQGALLHLVSPDSQKGFTDITNHQQ